ncbi:MAG: hypothetical protein M1813_006148 [Trichoglossum hirsutum]|nr:MAG: hypothetical protein M1813_006148 [Trichoglossum hirsutum]
MAEFFPGQSGMDVTEYTDLDIERISELLTHMDREAWNHVPRLYIILRRIGRLSLLDDFIKLHITDFWFPFSQSSLPSLLGPSERTAFLQQQQCVLTKATQLEKHDSGEHKHFADRERIPFQSKAILGTGGFSQVEKVVSLISFREYARKLIHRKRAFGGFQESMLDFERELKILKRVYHRHIVELVGSYTDSKYAALIMSPVADCDLSRFLRDSPSSADSISLMRTFFGCLATALSYLHDSSIRHKDIKPSNILVKDTTVLLTDFGLSLDCNDLTRSTTEGLTPLTRRYCAPEVAGYSPRNYSSDIWSLGCVFLEMMSVIKGISLDDLKAFFESRGSQTIMYWSNPEAIAQWIIELERSREKEPNNAPLDWVKRMLVHDRNERPTARMLVTEIINEGSVSGKAGEFCGICCRMDDDSDYPDGQILATNQVSASGSDLTPSDTVLPSVESVVSQPLSLSSTRSGELPRPDRSGPRLTSGPDSFHRVFAGLRIEQARYFILRSTQELDVETSVAHGIWASSKRVNTILDRAFLGAGGSIVLFFSVVGRKLCGVAEMTSAVDYDSTDEHWVEDRWQGRFTLNWISLTEVAFDQVKHLGVKEGSSTWSVISCYDGTEICSASGQEMLRIFGINSDSPS